MKWRFEILPLLGLLVMSGLFFTGRPGTESTNLAMATDIPGQVGAEIKRLSSPEPEKRARAARRLGEMGEKAVPAIPFLIELFGDTTKVRINSTSQSTLLANEARKALVKIGKPAVPALIAALAHKAWLIRCGAARTLEEIKDPRAVKSLAAAMEDKDGVVRRYAAKALGRTDFRTLLATLKHKKSEVRASTAWALGEIKDPRAVESLISALQDREPDVRSYAAEALGKTKDQRAIIPLTKVLKDRHRRVRENAALALGHLGDSSAVGPLISALRHSDWATRWKAAWALGMLKDPQAVKPLIEALEDEKPHVRHRAAWALGEIRALGAVESLTGLLNDEHVTVQRSAREALAKIAGEDLGPDARK